MHSRASMPKASSLIFSFCILLFGAAYSNSTDSDGNSIRKLDGAELTYAEVDSIVTGILKMANIPGLQLALFNDKRVKYVRSYGYRDSLKSIPVKNNTVWRGASFSKSIFACVVMKLVEEGKFDLDKPVQEYLDFPL